MSPLFRVIPSQAWCSKETYRTADTKDTEMISEHWDTNWMHFDGDDEWLQITFKWFQQDQPGERQTAQSKYNTQRKAIHRHHLGTGWGNWPQGFVINFLHSNISKVQFVVNKRSELRIMSFTDRLNNVPTKLMCHVPLPQAQVPHSQWQFQY